MVAENLISMNINEERNKIEKLERDLRIARANVQGQERNCIHSWGPIIDASEYHKGYTIPGDPPGTMGIDWRGPTHVAARTEQKWSRTCCKCGFVQFTKETVKVTIEKPYFHD